MVVAAAVIDTLVDLDLACPLVDQSKIDEIAKAKKDPDGFEIGFHLGTDLDRRVTCGSRR